MNDRDNAKARGRGFASMDAEKQRSIASLGGRAAHRLGTAHEFSSEEAREAGRKGGEAVSANRAHMAAIGRKYDVAERDARNRALGKAGEECVLHHERRHLSAAGRNDLADKVRWTSVQDGDGFGFDIRSFETDGREKLIEVKTTNGWERTPFHISRNELAVADTRREEWCLMRLWNFARAPSAFTLRSPLSDHAQLTATSFLAELN